MDINKDDIFFLCFVDRASV